MNLIRNLLEADQIQLDSLQSGAAARVQKLDEDAFVRRMWSLDSLLWAQDRAGQAEVRKQLGWLDAPRRSRGLLQEMNRLVRDSQLAGYTHALLMGMGGSSLAAEMFSLVFGTGEIYGKSGLELMVLDSIDPLQVRAAARWSEVEHTLYIVSSKSGTTAEIHALLDHFWNRARRKLGEKAAEHFIAITDPGTPLEKTARERRFRQVFLADPNTGGHFSALTAFGLVPAALMGIDTARLLDSAARMERKCTADRPAGSNPGLVLGAILAEAALRGRDKLTFLSDPRIASFGSWLEQLIAESSGKQGKGIIPVDQEPPLPPRKYATDRLFVYLELGGEQKARAAELRRAGQPVIELACEDPYEIGAEIYRWQVAVATACSILGVNCFFQPDVRETKERTLREITGPRPAHDEGPPTWEGTGGRAYGWDFPGLNGCKTLADLVTAFIAQAREGDYIAIQAFLPRSERTLASLQQLRARILKNTGRATTLGFGPRFLHSTGQLHKGGANNGLFLQITRQPSSDIEIQAAGITFGALERVQALVDLEALLARGRRAIRIHLVDGDIKDLLPK